MTTAHAQHVIRYTPTSVLLEDAWTTYTYWPTGDDPRSTLPPVGTEVEIVTSDFTPGTRPLATIADAHTGKRYGTVPTTDLFVFHRKGCVA